MKQIDQAERARINALRAAHYAAQKGDAPAPKKKPGRPKKTEAIETTVIAEPRARVGGTEIVAD